MSLLFSPAEVSREIERILRFLLTRIVPGQKVVLGLSGGSPSCALGVSSLFTVVQAEMEPSHLNNARKLAIELAVPLVELPLAGWAPRLIEALSLADPGEGFSNEALLDIGRAKNSLRTVIYSTYHDRGYLTLATSNRTEIECGFFVRLADGIWHLGPIAHLYKTQVYQLATVLGSEPEVIRQPASAGYWPGENDLEDLAYWLVNQKPIGTQRYFDAREIELANAIRAELFTDCASGHALPYFGSSVATAHRFVSCRRDCGDPGFSDCLIS